MFAAQLSSPLFSAGKNRKNRGQHIK